MEKPKLMMDRRTSNGQPAICIKIVRSINVPALHEIVTRYGFSLEVGISDCYQLILTDQATLNALRAEVKPFFNADGSFRIA